MTHRYALRFEEGERRGEVVALTGAATTFGRKPGNSVQVLDPSVSGKHAEVVVDGDQVTLRDLGSTNGSRVNGERISERRLQVGDRLMLGTVELVLLDTQAAPAAAPHGDGGDDGGIGLELESGEPEPRPAVRPSVEYTSVVPALRPPDAGEAVRSIGAEKLARSGKKNALAAVGLFLIAIGGGAAWWFTRGGGGAGGGAPLRAVEAVAGNLLAAGYSFETPDLPAGWSNAEDAAASFEPDRRARAGGAQGLSADLGPNSAARLSSEAQPAGRPMKLIAALGADGGARVRAGLRFESSTGACLPAEAWGPWVRASEGGSVEAREFAAALPATYDRVRALIQAQSGAEGGTALVDDVALVPAGSAVGRVVKLDDVELHLLGEPATGAVLFKIDHALLGGMGLSLPSGEEAPLEAAADPVGVRISTTAQGAVLEFTAESGTAAGGIATTAADGFKSHQSQFERPAVESIVLGAGRELVRLRFDAPALVRGLPNAGGSTFTLQVVGLKGALIQTSFSDDRVAAEALARDARAAARGGDMSRVIALWSRLINEHPIDAALIAEAEAGRAKALNEGLAAVAAVRADVERARFFRLLALFRECREKSLSIARAYAGSEVEARAKEVAAGVEQDIAVLAKDLDRLEARRLAEIHAALVQSKQAQLAARVAEELKLRFEVDDPAALLAGQAGGK